MNKKPLKVIKYCELWKQTNMSDGQEKYAIEKITVRSTGNTICVLRENGKWSRTFNSKTA